MDPNKEKIIKRFEAEVKDKKYDPKGFNQRHDGAEGHWLEKKMGITPNANAEADLFGYEMKKDTKGKTTFGDWSPDIALWKSKRPYPQFDKLDKDSQFLKYFGKPNEQKGGRLSWSGKPVPSIKGYNTFGQVLHVDVDNNIIASYSYSKDQRSNKKILIPVDFQIDSLIVAKWSADVMNNRVERKFNDKGWFKIYKDTAGVYTSIGFGERITYKAWIKLVREGIIYFDSGMYEGNNRPYSQWRANNNYWESLIIETF